MSERWTEEEITGFREAARSLKLYRRAELYDEQRDEALIEKLYVDPLPKNQVLQILTDKNTTFLTGRKGTGKSTVFQRAQHQLRQNKNATSAYVDIKTVYESSQVDDALLNKLQDVSGSLSSDQVRKLLLYQSFLYSVVKEIRSELNKQLSRSFWDRLRQHFRSNDEIFERLDEVLAEGVETRFVNALGIQAGSTSQSESRSTKSAAEASASASASSTGSFGMAAGASSERTQHTTTEDEYSSLLLRILDVRQVMQTIKEILETAKIRHLYIFVDDFSELPHDAMQIVVDSLIAPLNNWSDEFIKFKIAAYPGRIYFGQIDRSKIDEIYLDIYYLYGKTNISDMEENAIDFVSRLLTSRFQHFCGANIQHFFQGRDSDITRLLFYASMANPRILGYILHYLHDLFIIYQKPIGARAIREAAQKYYDEKIEQWFHMNRFLHESFAERSSIFGLKELLEKLVQRAKELRRYRDSRIIQEIQADRGVPPTSHFHVLREFESILATLELNFFLTKYFEMSDRDGKKVTVYALNFGLCQKYNIEYGRPLGQREYRLYFVERIFDYSPIIRSYMNQNQEIVCDNCEAEIDVSQIEALKVYNMKCPKCMVGTCEVRNLSRKYERLLQNVTDEQLLPQTELGIVQTLHTETGKLYAADIAGELDCSYQLVGRRAKNLADRGLVERDKEKNRRVFGLTDLAKATYFGGNEDPNLDTD